MSTLTEIEALATAGQKIMAIKEYRALTNLGLKDAKDAVEHRPSRRGKRPHSRRLPRPLPSPPSHPSPRLPQRAPARAPRKARRIPSSIRPSRTTSATLPTSSSSLVPADPPAMVTS